MLKRRFLPFWAVNDNLDLDRLKEQLGSMKVAGFEGVVFQPRFFPNEPKYLEDAYLEILSATILYAKSLDLAFWIYDENGWPSGVVDGEMLRIYPELRQQWAGLYRESPDGGEVICEFSHLGVVWKVCLMRGAGVDYLNPELAQRFIELTYDRYRFGLSVEAFEYVEAFFCDEPELGLGHAYDSLPEDGAIPWTGGLAGVFETRFGKSLESSLPAVFFRDLGEDADRVQFWEMLRDRFCEGFLARLNDWCEANGKVFTTHIKGEEHPLFQVPMVGSCQSVFRNIGLPGIDSLERYPSNDYFPRQLVSSARQFGDGRSMVEALGGAGWGVTPEDVERYLVWLGEHGITDFVLHLWQFRLSSHAIRDWPASLPIHMNWAELFPELLKRVKDRLSVNSQARVLMVTPHRGVMAVYEPRELLLTNVHNAGTYPDTPAGRINDGFLAQVRALKASGVDVDFVDENTFETYSKVVEGRILVGKIAYESLIVDASARFNEVGEAFIRACERLVRSPTGVEDKKGDAPAFCSVDSCQRVSISWREIVAPENACLIEFGKGSDGCWSGSFECREVEGFRENARVVFADAITVIRVNGLPVQLNPGKEGFCGELGSALVEGCNLVEAQFGDDVEAPFVWMKGDFIVQGQGEFVSDGKGHICGTGPFSLCARVGSVFPDVEWCSAGYPFSRGPVVGEGEFELSHSTNILRLGSVYADAARFYVDGKDLGWGWGPDWRWSSGARFDSGRHSMRVELVPSTYNYFGPHRYFEGDRHVVSPDQFSGRRNFADPADAPACTFGKIWHFRPTRLPEVLLAEETSSRVHFTL